MKIRVKPFLAVLPCVIAFGSIATDAIANDARKTSTASKPPEEGTIQVPAFDLPLSEHLSAESRAVLKRRTAEFAAMRKECPLDLKTATEKDVIAKRRCVEKDYFPTLIGRYRARYAVNIQPETIAGVATEIITPAGGVSEPNRRRVLINLHSGGFIGGGRWSGQVESIPIAAVGKFKVVSVDYRLAPEYQFPAASEDVAAVYKALLKDYRPEDIGIFGCSAGGILAAESVAWFQKEGLPAPGAIGMFCAAAFLFENDDSTHISDAISGSPTKAEKEPKKFSYFREGDQKKPLANPGIDPRVMAKFPDSLLITATRDAAMSSVVATHSLLTRLGVEADLHVWEGLGHAFYLEPDYPESREVYDVIARFFSKHLGKNGANNVVASTH